MADPALPGILGSLAPVLDHFGYLAVGGFLFLEDFGVPVPGETVLIAAAVYAGAGRLNIVTIVLIAILASIVGDNVGYLIGKYGGRKLALRWGKYVFLTEERLEKAENFFTRHGGKVVTIARFIEGLRQANGIIAGITKMPWRKFMLFNALGAIIWCLTWSGVGYLAGNHITAIYEAINRYALYVLIAVVVLIGFLIVRRVRRKRSERAAAGASDAETPDASDGPGIGAQPVIDPAP